MRNLIYETGAHSTYCEYWRALPDEDQTWYKFKDFSKKADHDLHESHLFHDPQVTVAVYQANLANHHADQALTQKSDALEAVANLVVASSEDKQSISTLTQN